MNSLRWLAAAVVSGLSFGGGAATPGGLMSSECPFDGTAIQTPGRVAGQQTGFRLDLRPVGEGALEEGLGRCPRCQFIADPVLTRDQYLEATRRVVASPAYGEEARGGSAHALRALLVAEVLHDAREEAFEWLRASWELEGGAPEPWRRATEKALAAFVRNAQQPIEPDSFDDDRVSALEQRRTAQLMQVELLRRLGRFSEALVALDALAARAEMQRGAYLTLLAVERSLIERKERSPQPFPDIPPFDPRADDPPFIAAQSLAGWKQADAGFVLTYASFDTHHGQRNSLVVMVHAREPRLLDEARWYDTAKNGAPQFSWTQFLAAYVRVEQLVQQNPWLLEWKTAGPSRHLELWLGGLGTDFDDLDRIAWRDAGFQADPAAQIELREDELGVGNVYLAAGGGGIVTSVSEKRTRDHWLTAEPFFFHPRGRPPTYLRIGADGKWEHRVLGRAADPENDERERRLKQDPLLKRSTP